MSKRLRFLHGNIKSPPMSDAARTEAGKLLRRLQNGKRLEMPLSRPMSDIGQRVNELRINDERMTHGVSFTESIAM